MRSIPPLLWCTYRTTCKVPTKLIVVRTILFATTHILSSNRNLAQPLWACQVESLDSLFVGFLGSSFLAHSSYRALRIVSRMCWRSSIFVLVLILTLVSTRRGRRIHIASKIPFYLLSYLSIRHLQNYGVKTRELHGRGKDPLPLSSTKRYSSHGPSVYRTVPYMETETCFCFHFNDWWKQTHVFISISTTDGNDNMFPFPTNKSSNHGLHINPNSHSCRHVHLQHCMWRQLSGQRQLSGCSCCHTTQ